MSKRRLQTSAAFERIMCAVDLTDKSIPTMQFAPGWRSDFHAKLWLVHAVPGAETRPQKYFEADLQAFLEDEASKAIGKMQETAGVVAQLCLGAGEVPHVVREAALHHARGPGDNRARACHARARAAADQCVFDHPAIALSGDQCVGTCYLPYKRR